ncbi:MAG: DUF4331 domain-containing protein [Oleiphilaceae bacterium]|nr:DUF4331 domain-containing protein [Oleiphilaceae bacterium]
MKTTFQRAALATAVAGLCLSTAMVQASSHREAPFITEKPKVDGTDFYMFRSYETGREDFVTLIANYQPLQAAYGGPNYFDMDDDAIYEIHIDNTADGVEDLTLQFDFTDVNQDIALDVGGTTVSVPLKNAGEFGPGADTSSTPFTGDDAIATRQTYTLKVIQGDRRTGAVNTATNVTQGGTTFRKAMDNIGNRSIPQYADYADQFIYEFSVANCATNGRVFVGQRQEAFSVNLGEVFDLVNISNPGGARDQGLNELNDSNVTSIAVEMPIDCVNGPARTSADAGEEPVIGGWTTASVRQAEIINPEPTDKAFDASTMGQKASIKGGAFTQVSRLGMPLVNEVVIGLKDKDKFNHSEPVNDAVNFAPYVTNPTLPKLLSIVTGGAVAEPNVFPRVDIIASFLTGLTLRDSNDTIIFSNKPVSNGLTEMLRLNTAVAPANSDVAQQNDLGLLGGDLSGFPNGRRPVDDVVDIELRVVIGAILPQFGENDPNGGFEITDGAVVDRTILLNRFPYLGTPIPGSPNQ